MEESKGEIEAKVILETTREIVWMLCCTLFITCPPPKQWWRRKQRESTWKRRMRKEQDGKRGKSEKTRFYWWTKETLSFASHSADCFAVYSAIVCALLCYNLRPSMTSVKGREKEEERESEIGEGENNRTRKGGSVNVKEILFFMCFSITIITSSPANIRFRLGKHVFERVKVRLKTEKSNRNLNEIRTFSSSSHYWSF